MNYHPLKLFKELENASVPIHSVNEDGVIDFKEEATQAQKDQAEAIKASHDPVYYVEKRASEYPPIGDQLDHLYRALKEYKDQGTWNGIDEWFAKIENIKNKYPKN